MPVSRRFLLLLLVVSFLALPACRSVGPPSIPRDQFDYSTAIAESWKRQMLANIVKMRYGEPPVFLEVASVINQYSLQGQVSLGANNAKLGGGNVFNMGGNATYADRPTITYNPLSGDKFTKSLLTPVPPDRILWLMQSGYGADFVLRLGTRSVNGIKNHVDITAIHHAADPQWGELLGALSRIQRTNSIGMRLEPTQSGPTMALFFQPGTSDSTAQSLERVQELLGLDPTVSEYRVVYGLPKDNREIALQTRSLIEMMSELGASIEVPEEHVEEGVAKFVPYHEGEQRYLIDIRSGEERPDSAFVATEYAGYWFWIDDADIRSKQTLTFMMYLSSIAETGSGMAAPLVTVSAGGS